jgi:integrase
MARAAVKLTKRDLDALRTQAEADTALILTKADGGQPGLRVQTRRGKVRFEFEYRPPNGGRRRVLFIDTYGAITLDQARDAAQRLRGQVSAERADPIEARRKERRDSTTVAEAVAAYLKDYEERVRTGVAQGRRGTKRSGMDGARRLLERHVIPAFGAKRLRDLTTDHVRRMHKALADTPGTADHALSAVRSLYSWAASNGLVAKGTDPTDGVGRFNAVGKRRALTVGELARLGAAMRAAEGKVHPSALLAIRLIALTGLRRGEVLGHAMKTRRGDRDGLRWGDLDLDRGLVHLRDTKTGDQTRAIGRAAVELLRAAKPAKAKSDDRVCDYVQIDKVRRTLFTAAGIAETAEGCADLHSLRHSFASVGVKVQHNRYLNAVPVLLGHGYNLPEITRRYADERVQRAAANAISAVLARILGVRRVRHSNVVAFPAGAAAR